MPKNDMRLTVTREQIRAALGKLYKVDVEDFTIIPAAPSAIGIRCRSVVCRPEIADTKISNIKAMRRLATNLRQPMTLMEGKWAVENWDRFIAFVDEYNRLPLGGYGSGDGKGILK